MNVSHTKYVLGLVCTYYFTTAESMTSVESSLRLFFAAFFFSFDTNFVLSLRALIQWSKYGYTKKTERKPKLARNNVVGFSYFHPKIIGILFPNLF